MRWEEKYTEEKLYVNAYIYTQTFMLHAIIRFDSPTSLTNILRCICSQNFCVTPRNSAFTHKERKRFASERTFSRWNANILQTNSSFSGEYKIFVRERKTFDIKMFLVSHIFVHHRVTLGAP